MTNEELHKEIKIMQSQLDFIRRALVPLAKGHKPSQWMDEIEMMEATGYSKRTLIEKRKQGLFDWRKAPGHKGYEYHRESVEAYKNQFSTIS